MTHLSRKLLALLYRSVCLVKLGCGTLRGSLNYQNGDFCKETAHFSYIPSFLEGIPFIRMHSVFAALILLIMEAMAPAGIPAQTTSLEDLDVRLAQRADISDLVAYAYRENPMIQMSREAWRATIEKYRLATGYPDPQVSVTYFPQPIETRLGPQDWNASISQMIPFPGKLSKAGAVVEADARIARLKLDQAVRDVVVSIRESVYELGYIRRARRIAAHNMELLQDLRKVSETAYAQDRTALLDMVKAQSQSGQLRYDMLLLEDLEQTEITRLNGLLNRPPEALIGRIEPDQEPSFNYDLQQLYRLAEENQEEIRMAGAGIDKADANLDLARYEYLPEFRVGLFYAAIGDPDVPQDPPDAGDDALGIQFGMTLPLWFGKNKSRVSQARAEMAQAKAAKSGRINETRTQIHALFFRMQNARRLIELYRDELLPQAARSMQIAETWFRQGESSFSDFIETQAVNYNFQLALARAQADYGKFRARLERLLGSGIAESGREAEQRKPEEANRLQDQDAGVNP